MNSMIDLFKYDSTDVSNEILEMGIDALLKDDSILEKLPIINIILGTKKTLSSINEAFLVRKMLKFLKLAGQIPLEDRVNFISKHLNGKEREFAEKVTHTITRQDDVNKSNFIAKLYKSAIYEIITLEEFYRFIGLVDKIYIDDINFLLKTDENNFKGLHPYLLTQLGITERINTYGDLGGKTSISTMNFKITTFGEKFKKSLI